MKQISLFFILSLAIFSCKKSSYDSFYTGEKNYKSFYVVDTIVIESPVRVFSKRFGGMFVMPIERLDNYRNKIDFFLEPDVFILGNDLYRDLDITDFDKYVYPENGECLLSETEMEISGLEIYKYKQNVKFLFGLINTNYYHKRHNSYNYFSMPSVNPKSTYIKIVYPLCNEK